MAWGRSRAAMKGGPTASTDLNRGAATGIVQHVHPAQEAGRRGCGLLPVSTDWGFTADTCRIALSGLGAVSPAPTSGAAWTVA